MLTSTHRPQTRSRQSGNCTGPAIAKNYSFTNVRQIVDVGGGHGEVLAAILHAFPHIRGTLFELPSVAAKLRDRDMSSRCEVIAGDMFRAGAGWRRSVSAGAHHSQLG
jgi:hypothetical protein